MKEKVSNYLKSKNIGKTPTEIGIALGKSYTQASSSVSGALKALIKDGLIMKQKIGGRVLYKWKK